MHKGGAVMDFQMILEALANQGIWCLLFVWLFYTDRSDSKAREEKLMAVIDEHGEQLEKITETLNNINDKVERVEHTA